MLFLDVVNPTFAYFAPWIMLVIAAVAVVFVLMLPYLTHHIVLFIKAKTGIVISQHMQTEFIDLVNNAVLQVEQLARQKLKLGEGAPEGAKKLEQAVDIIEKRLKASGTYDQFKDLIVDQIETAVAHMNGPLTEEEKALVIEPDKDEKKKIGG
jgi:hypothetical protein